MKNWVLICLCLCLTACIMSAGCNKEKIAVATYEGVGQVLVEFKTEVEAKYQAGEINDEFYQKAKESYSKARESYILAGNTLILIIEIGNDAQKENLLWASMKHLDEAQQVISSMLAILKAQGVDMKKVAILIDKLKS